METWGRALDLEICQSANRFSVSWYNVEMFAVPPTKHGLVYAAAPLFCLS